MIASAPTTIGDGLVAIAQAIALVGVLYIMFGERHKK